MLLYGIEFLDKAITGFQQKVATSPSNAIIFRRISLENSSNNMLPIFTKQKYTTRYTYTNTEQKMCRLFS